MKKEEVLSGIKHAVAMVIIGLIAGVTIHFGFNIGKVVWPSIKEPAMTVEHKVSYNAVFD